MARFNPRKFTDPDWLRSITPALLFRLLTRWDTYFIDRGFPIPTATDAEPDYDALAKILIAPTATTPGELLEALHFIRETSSAEDMDALLAAAQAGRLPISVDRERSAADVAIEIWLADPDLIYQRHAEVVARHQKAFLYFGGRTAGGRSFPHLDAPRCHEIERVCDDWFDEHRRGRGCRLFQFREPPHVWLLVRHGQPMRREASHQDDGSAGTEFFRPQRHDVLLYDERTDELGVYAGTKGERVLYLRTLGQVLFSDPDYFPQAAKYTLDPLIQDAAAALVCDDIDGIDQIRLVEFRRDWGGPYKEQEVRRATDLVAAVSERAGPGFAGGHATAAVFKVKFAHARQPRSITIRPPAVARYERNEDSQLVEQWLAARGFLVNRSTIEQDDADTAALLGRD
jgi:hypothetical protein